MKNIGTIIVFNDEESWIRTIVSRFFSVLQDLSTNNDRICIAVSGGSTPYPAYKAIRDSIIIDAKLLSIAEKTHVFLVDERLLPLSHPDSNSGRLLEVWGHLPFRIYPIKFALDSDNVVLEYKTRMLDVVKCDKQALPVFDLVFLGMGNDGHTASLFPNSEALTNNSDIVVINNVEDKYHERITLTFPVLRAAQHKMVLIKGKEKTEILNQMIAAKQTAYPIERLMDGVDSNLEWFIN